MAFIVQDKWHNKGIGTYLLRYLIQIARRNGIAGFTAEVLHENKAMQTVFQKSGCTIKSSHIDGVYLLELEFE